MSTFATNEFPTRDVEVEHRRDLILIESMVRDGRSEGEIVAAVLGRRDDGAELGQSTTGAAIPSAPREHAR